MINKNFTVKDLILCSLFTALIAIGAFIRIPVPVVPFTLQFLFTTLAGMLLGARLGAISVSIYVILGLIGIPVFAEGGGLGYIFKPSFGYLIGFIAGTYLTGKLTESMHTLTTKKLAGAAFSGLLVVYAFGMAYYYLIGNYIVGKPIALWPLFLYCFLLAVPGDIVLCLVAGILSKKIKPFI